MTWQRKIQKNALNSNSQLVRRSMFQKRGFSPRTTESDNTSITGGAIVDYSKVDFSLHGQHLLQPKLTVGVPEDKYEQEADAMASQVMSMPNTVIQRKMAPEEQKEKEAQTNLTSASIQREVLLEKEVQTKPSLQRATDGSFQAGGNIESQLNNSKGGGTPLSDEVRGFMEPRFGADFSSVRVHTGDEAVQMNRELGAQAFTHGSNVYFGAGKAPGNNELTAHELTHVVQQRGRDQTKLTQNENTPDVQQKCSVCAEEDNTLKRKEAGMIQVVQRKIGDGHDLTSPRFAGDPVLEACFDGEHRMLIGETGSAVEKVQQALTDLGLSLKVDGMFGSKTQAAVAKFKRDNGIQPSDGVVGSKTMAELDGRFQATQDKPPVVNNPPIECPVGTQPSVASEKLTNPEFTPVSFVGTLCQITPPINPRAWITLLPRAQRDSKTKTTITVQKGNTEKPLNIPEPKSILQPTGVPISEDAKAEIIDSINKKRNDKSIPNRVDPSNDPKKGLARVNDSRGFGFQYNGKDGSRKPSKLEEGAARRTEVNKVVWDEIGGEGGASAINTYDPAIVTWGKGFSAKGDLPSVLAKFCKKDPTVCEELLDAGISAIDEKGKKKWLVVNTETGLVEEEDNALHLIQFDTQLLSLLIDLAERDDSHTQNFLDAQFETVRANAGNVPDEIINNTSWDNRTIAFVAHCVHAFPAKPWSSYLDTTGNVKKVIRSYGEARSTKFNSKNQNQIRRFRNLMSKGAKVVSGDITQFQFITFAPRDKKIGNPGLAKDLLGEPIVPDELQQPTIGSDTSLLGKIFFEEKVDSKKFYRLE